jgi:hypothetical protein
LQNEANFLEWNQHFALAAPAVTGATKGNQLGPERLRLIGGGISEILIYPPDQLALVSSRFQRLEIFRGKIGKDDDWNGLVHDQDAATNDQTDHPTQLDSRPDRGEQELYDLR